VGELARAYAEIKWFLHTNYGKFRVADFCRFEGAYGEGYSA